MAWAVATSREGETAQPQVQHRQPDGHQRDYQAVLGELPASDALTGPFGEAEN
jgi:hypothetical protein